MIYVRLPDGQTMPATSVDDAGRLQTKLLRSVQVCEIVTDDPKMHRQALAMWRRQRGRDAAMTVASAPVLVEPTRARVAS